MFIGLIICSHFDLFISPKTPILDCIETWSFVTVFFQFFQFSWFFSWSLLGLGPFWLVPFGRSLMGWFLLTSNAEEVYFFSDYTKISNIECISTHRLRSSVSKNSCENLFNVSRACTPHSASKSKRILQFQEFLTKYSFLS